MKREIFSVKVKRFKPRAQFLFNDGEFKPKTAKSGKKFVRREKVRQGSGEYDYQW